MLHQICLETVPKSLFHRESFEALVCGKNIADMHLKQLLSDTSLIHIFVVSGSHFILLRNFLAKALGKTSWLLIPLFGYAMVTLCQPPSLRALAFLALLDIANRRKLFLTNIQLVLLSGILCVAIYPQWIHSRSLAMSLMAALAMSSADEILDRKMPAPLRMFLSQSLMYFAMGFCLWGISSLHPLSILMNVLIGPLIGILLFPLGLLTLLLPPFVPIFDSAMSGLIWLLEKTNPLLKISASVDPLKVVVLWILITVLLSFTHRWCVRVRRNRYEV
ncbi:MAG: hypothetical protein EOP04_17240 [Proteobacteria bacterium]|nr:MAG: hypothetical protein EOP04_17240 [Pseudomonadota bacterium]